MDSIVRSSWIDDSDDDSDHYGSPTLPSFRTNTIDPSSSVDQDRWASDNFKTRTTPSGQTFHSPLLRSASEGQSSFNSDTTSSRSFSRPSKSLALPDPSQFPDPYPFQPPHHHLLASSPGLSSTDSSSASTRSSAYTSSGSGFVSGDYGHVHVVSADDDPSAPTGITTEAVVRLLANDSSSSSSSSAQGSASRAPIDRSRWSESYSASIRSRSSSVGNNTSATSSSTNDHPRLNDKPSYDIGWQTVDERDEVGMSEDETDDDNMLETDDEKDQDEDDQVPSAVKVAEEGSGLIVRGDGLPISQLQIQPGTTHLMIASSTSPNAMPSFLATTLPRIALTLLALDISANFLGALPPTLAICANLEELNIASNPLRVLPVFLGDLTNLRVLIADSTGITTLPEPFADLDKLHTLSVRRNKMHSLPSWLCLLPGLKSLFVDGNPFQGPWKALVEPLLAKVPSTPVYPLSTPMFPVSPDVETDLDDSSDPPSASPTAQFSLTPDEEEHTITPDRAPFLQQPPPPIPEMKGTQLVRTRTTPNRRYSPNGDKSQTVHEASTRRSVGEASRNEVRKMKSAGDLRRAKDAVPIPPAVESRPPLTHSSTSVPLSEAQASPPRPGPKRFASQGPSSVFGDSPGRSRPALAQSVWEPPSEGFNDPSTSPPSRVSFTPPEQGDSKANLRPRPGKDGKERNTRWGFLKKMSMGKMRVEPPRQHNSHPAITGPLSQADPGSSLRSSPSSSKTPQINMRISTTGALDNIHLPVITSSLLPPTVTTPDSDTSQDTGADSLRVPTPSTPNFLAPPSPTPRSAKRRSFLPIESPFHLSVPIPEPSSFVPGVTATNGDETDVRARSPSPVALHADFIRKEEERAREAYSRALRSVMAYLRDMNDLGQHPLMNPSYPPGSIPEEAAMPRSRRPTIGEASRESSVATPTLSSLDSSNHLRSSESMGGLRVGAPQTMSVVTTDSTGSQEDRKYKDDKGKRAMVLKEIVVTERTYVQGLQELVDIYIKPGSVAVNMLSGVGSAKETVVPAAERKVVFGGIDGLHSFHKDNFLPALEKAVAPLMKSSSEIDPDGQLSLQVSRNVGQIFLKHAAFMRMYSSYINNFDSAVQRVKHWASSRSTSGPSSPAMSPSSSTSQLASLGLSITAISAPGVAPDAGAANGVPGLSTSQRKRIRSYLKRCRMNPRHSQLNLDGYLLLPVQRIPRYRLLLEELVRSTPPSFEYTDDPLERSLSEISLLANNMNEGKREAESRRKLVHWQSRIRGKFPSPLVQPHRRLIMDGPLLLTRVVRKAMISFEAINAQGDSSTVQVDCLAPELTPRPLVGILCNDLLVLCRDPTEGQDLTSSVDLWAVLRMQTLPQPASIVHGNALRLVDNKAILYFDAPSPSDALNWYRGKVPQNNNSFFSYLAQAINLHIPASKS